MNVNIHAEPHESIDVTLLGPFATPALCDPRRPIYTLRLKVAGGDLMLYLTAAQIRALAVDVTEAPGVLPCVPVQQPAQ